MNGDSTAYCPETNFLVVSEGGKPIWFRYGAESEMCRFCGLIQALSSSTLCSTTNSLQTIKSPQYTLVFLKVQSITLVAIDSNSTPRQPEAFARLQLEYLYAQLLFTLTDQIQSFLRQDPSFDVRNLLGSTQLDVMDPMKAMAAIPIRSLRPALRQALSQSLLLTVETASSPPVTTAETGDTVASAGSNLLYAMILVDHSHVVTLIQPRERHLQLRAADLQLILLQLPKLASGGGSGDAWFPMCLPHIHTSGFLHALMHTLDSRWSTAASSTTSLQLLLVSSHGTTQELQTLRLIKEQLRVSWGLEKSDNDDTDGTPRKANGSKEDYIDAAGNGDSLFPYLPELELGKQLMQSLSAPAERQKQEDIYNNYMSLAQATHFWFRLNFPIQNSLGHSSQCFSWPQLVPERARQVWSTYQKLCLRLRLGSATIESSLDAMDMIVRDKGISYSGEEPASPVSSTSIGSDCPMMGLLEAPPNLQGVTYMSSGLDTCMAMSGQEFELYLTTGSSLLAEEAAALGAKLARQILHDRENLFLTEPLTWGE